MYNYGTYVDDNSFAEVVVVLYGFERHHPALGWTSRLLFLVAQFRQGPANTTTVRPLTTPTYTYD